MRRTITVEQQSLALTGVELAQRISLSGSLKATITEVASLTGTGELTVMARYGLA